VRFVERAVATPGGAARVAARAREVSHAVAGLNPDAAGRLRGVVAGILSDPHPAPGRTACARLAAGLPPGDPGLDRRAADVLAEELRGADPGVVVALAEDLAVLAGRLAPGEAAATVGPAARHLVGRLGAGGPTGGAEQFSRGLEVLAPRLPVDDREALASEAAREVVAAVTLEDDAGRLAGLVRVLEALAPGLRPDEAGGLARTVAGRAAGERSPAVLRLLVRGVEALAVALDERDRVALVGVLAGREALDDPARVEVLGPVLHRLTDGGPVPQDVREAVAAAARRAVDRMAVEPDPAALAGPARAVTAVGRRLVPGDAGAEMTRDLLAQAVVEPDPVALGAQLHAAVGLLPLGPDHQVAAARVLGARLAGEADTRAAEVLARGLAAFLGGRPRGDAVTHELATPAARRLGERLARETDPGAVADLAWALRALVPHVTPAEAARLSGVLFARVSADSDPVALAALSGALLATVRGRPPADVAAAGGPAVGRLVAGARGADPARVPVLARAVAEWAGVLPATDGEGAAGEFVRAVMGRDDWETDLTARSDFDAALVVLVGFAGPVEAERVVAAWSVRLAGASDPRAVRRLARGARAAAPRLGPATTVRLAGVVAERLAVEADWACRADLAAVLGVLATRLSEADLASLLRAHLPFGGPRAVLVAEFGRRAGWTGALPTDVWVVADRVGLVHGRAPAPGR
jgi:hypothetical protein